MVYLMLRQDTRLAEIAAEIRAGKKFSLEN